MESCMSPIAYTCEEVVKREEWMKELRLHMEQTQVERSRKYAERNDEKWHIRVTCECGSTINQNSLVSHVRTRRHQKFLEKMI